MATATDERLAAELLEQISRLRRSLRRSAGSPWPAGTMTGAQTELARLVRRQPGLSVNRAAEELQLAPNTVSSLVSQLADAGLLRRARDERDRRVARLELTPAARRRLEAWRDERATALRVALDRLDEDDRRALREATASLARLVDAVDG